MQPEELRMLFRTNMKRRREELRLSQTEVARRMEVAPGYICDLERGAQNPGIKTLAGLAEALETSPAWLLSADAFPPVHAPSVVSVSESAGAT